MPRVTASPPTPPGPEGSNGNGGPGTRGLFVAACGVVLAATLLAAIVALLGSDARVRSGALVIAPGREGDVMAFVQPVVDAGFMGRVPAQVQIEGAQIRIPLSGPATAPTAGCHGPHWVSAPGALIISHVSAGPVADTSSEVAGDVRIGWARCDLSADPGEGAAALASLAQSLATRPHAGLWTAAAHVVPRPGVLTPLAPAVGPRWLMLITLALGVGAAIGVARWVGPGAASRPPPRAHLWIAAAIAAAGAAARLYLAATLPLDPDESWALPATTPVFSDDHDAWIHPPLFRLLQQTWIHAIGWQPGDTLVALRGPSLLAATVALSICCVALCRSRARVWPLMAGIVALSPAIAAPQVLARPYGLATMFVVVAMAAAADPGSGRTRATLVCAVGLAAWTDFVAGAAALVIVAATLAAPRPDAGLRACRVATALAVLAWIAPLLPGAYVAATEPLAPLYPGPTGATPDLDPLHGLGGGSVVGFARAMLGFAVFGGVVFQTGTLALGIVAVAALAALAARRRRLVGVIPLVICACLVVLSTQIAMRPRNFAFLPYLLMMAAAATLRPRD